METTIGRVPKFADTRTIVKELGLFIYSLRSLHWYPSHEQYLSSFEDHNMYEHFVRAPGALPPRPCPWLQPAASADYRTAKLNLSHHKSLSNSTGSP